MLLSVQRVKKGRGHFRPFQALGYVGVFVWGLLGVSGEGSAKTSKTSEKAFIKKIHAHIEEGLHALFPQGHETLAIKGDLKGFSPDGKRKQVIKDAEGKQHHLFIKIFYEHATPAHRKRVVEVTRRLAEVWGYPLILWHDPQYHVMITEFLEHPHVKPQDFQQEGFLEAFVHRLKASHALLKTMESLEKDPLVERTKRRFKELMAVEPLLEGRLQKAKDFLEKFESSTQDAVHGDIQKANILKHEHPLLIDWSDVRWGDVFEDLGSLAEEMEFNPAQEEKLLKQYFGTVSKEILEKLHNYRTLHRLHFGLYFTREGFKELKLKREKAQGKAFAYHPSSLQKGIKLLREFLDKRKES